MKIVIGNSTLATYPQGGGHWAWGLRYLLGLDSLGHDVTWLELMAPSGDPDLDRSRIEIFLHRMWAVGMGDNCILALHEGDQGQVPVHAQIFGTSVGHATKVIDDADMLWNLALAIQPPLLSRVRSSALVDVDPGHLQGAALEWDILTHHGWEIVDPYRVAGTPEEYRTFIGTSKAELGCPKPIYRELRTGWLSDRSAAYLASGRPVVAEEHLDGCKVLREMVEACR